MTDSQPPSSEDVPGTSGGAGFYLAGIILMAGMTGGLLYWRFRTPPAQPPPRPTVVTQSPAELGPLHALPPPPKLPDTPAESASAPPVIGAPGSGPGGAVPTGAAVPSAVVAAPAGVCSACGEGQSSAALASSMQSAAEAARGCYKRALRNSQVSGSISISVQVGSNGSVCAASITKDTVGSGEIASCVLGKFQGRSFPAPQSGCVVVNIPLKFELQQ